MKSKYFLQTLSLEQFFVFSLCSAWRTSIETGFENIFQKTLTDLYFRRKKQKTLLVVHKKWKIKPLEARFKSRLWFLPDQQFRNFFKLKNISKETFDSYLNFISQKPYNCNWDALRYPEDVFWEKYNYSLLHSDNVNEKEKQAVCDAIEWILFEFMSKNP